MTRRFMLAIVSTVVVTLVVVVLGTSALTRRANWTATERDLRIQAEELATAAADSRTPIAFLQQLRKSLKLQGVGVVPLGNTALAQLPAGITLPDLRVAALRRGLVVSGRRGSLIYAAATAATLRGNFAVVLTKKPVSPLHAAGGWFLLCAIGAVVLAALVALSLSRRLTKPLREAQVATHRIAAGELSTRIPIPRRRRPDELTDLTESINAMASTLERSQTLEQRFLLSVSHDLRTPLTSIRGYAEAIADGAVRDPRTAAEVIMSQSTRLERLVRDLLDLAKLEQRVFTFHVRPTDLADVAADAAGGLAHDASRNGVDVQVSAPVPVIVHADPDRLAQVVANLTENAMKFAKTRVTVTALAANGSGLLTVDDDGPGIGTDDLPHVFERLYTARHAPQRKEVGSGLGLAIVRELVQGMGGTVAATAAPGGGARMTVQLPLAP